MLRVGVIGAGLQGAGVAIELALGGASVTLFEKRSACLTQASMQNEGKIHLGFVYAKDGTLRTARLLAEGALQFEPIVTRWLDQGLRSEQLSSPFQYLVHRDSQLNAEELATYYGAVTGILESVATQPAASYFGHDATAPVRRVSDGGLHSDTVTAAFQTPEIAIDPVAFAELLRSRLFAEPGIRVQCDARIRRVSHDQNGATVEVETQDGTCIEHFDHIVNASWEDLLAIDTSAGVTPRGPWSFRVKHFIRMRMNGGRSRISSSTIVLGGFGDIVVYGNDDVFLSWYPVGMRGISSDLQPPDWPLKLVEPQAAAVRKGIFDGLRDIVPGVGHLSMDLASCDVRGGIILALGDTDIDDPVSRLHERSRVGPRSFGRYHSVDTGKYTLAPLFARRMANHILGCS